MIKTPMILIHSPIIPAKPIVITLKKEKNAEIFTTDIMKAVINEGEPWYTSGLHMWKGAIETLNDNATNINTAPAINIKSFELLMEYWWIV